MDQKKQEPSAIRSLHHVLRERMNKFFKETSADELVEKLEAQGVKFVEISNAMFDAADNVFEQHKKRYYHIVYQTGDCTMGIIHEYVYANEIEIKAYLDQISLRKEVSNIKSTEIKIINL